MTSGLATKTNPQVEGCTVLLDQTTLGFSFQKHSEEWLPLGENCKPSHVSRKCSFSIYCESLESHAFLLRATHKRKRLALGLTALRFERNVNGLLLIGEDGELPFAARVVRHWNVVQVLRRQVERRERLVRLR